VIDLISTRVGTELEAAGCARLLAAVIAQAITDATEDFLPEEESIAAALWLFDPKSVFPLYAHLIGVDAEGIRRNLLEGKDADKFVARAAAGAVVLAKAKPRVG
jgi:hypothetical protein